MRNRNLPISVQLSGLGMRQDQVFDDPDFPVDQSSRPDQVAPIIIPPSVNDPAWPIIASTGQELRGPWLPDAGTPAPVIPGSAGSGTKTIILDPLPMTPAPAPTSPPLDAVTPAAPSSDAPPVLVPVGSGGALTVSPVMLPLYAAETVDTPPAIADGEPAPASKAKTLLSLLALLTLFSN